MKVFEYPKCRKRLANRHNLSRYNMNCGKGLCTIQHQLCNDILAVVVGKRPINPENVSFDGITSGSNKSINTGTDGHPKNPKIDVLCEQFATEIETYLNTTTEEATSRVSRHLITIKTIGSDRYITDATTPSRS